MSIATTTMPIVGPTVVRGLDLGPRSFTVRAGHVPVDQDLGSARKGGERIVHELDLTGPGDHRTMWRRGPHRSAMDKHIFFIVVPHLPFPQWDSFTPLIRSKFCFPSAVPGARSCSLAPRASHPHTIQQQLPGGIGQLGSSGIGQVDTSRGPAYRPNPVSHSSIVSRYPGA